MRRTSLILAFGGLAPLAIFGAMVAAGQLREQNQRNLTQAMAAAREVNAAVDGVLMADAALLSVFSTSPTIVAHDWPEARIRSLRITRDRPGITDIALIDPVTRRQVWSGHDGVGERPAPPDVIAYLDGRQPPAISDAIVAGPGCPCIALYQDVFENGRPRYLLTARRGIDPFEKLLIERATAAGEGPPKVSAIVDREGRFLARSIGYAERKGRFATRYVREAIVRGKTGTYSGVTYEGLRNRTAFATSSLSGFSTHIAMPAGRFSLLGAGSAGLTLAAVVIALVVALVAIRAAWLEQVRWRRDQQQAIQGQKMEALGRFASGVAHDFNNVLQVVLGSAQMLSRTVTDPVAAKRIDLIRQAAEKGAGLTRELLQFGRDKPLEIESVALLPLLRDLEGLLARALGDSVGLEIAPIDPDLTVRSNRAGLEMALLNLAGNARDAMPGGGALTIAAGPARRAGQIDLSLTDTGQGMSEEVAARALDPFFTTKQPGKGTGLGLAQVNSLMHESGGHIAIASKPGAGTTITLTFRQA